MPTSKLEPDQILHAVQGRLLAAMPTVSDIRIESSPAGYLELRFHHQNALHRFRLHRADKLWHLDEHRVNGQPQPRLYNGHAEKFEDLILAVIRTRYRPRIEVVDLRCPDDPRRLFAKLIVQRRNSLGDDPAGNLLEFSCPQCKRTNGHVTMHIFNSMTGELVKTEAHEPWIKREPSTPWFTRPHDSAPAEALEPVRNSA